MREKIISLLLSAFGVSGIKAIPKDTVNYSIKAGMISPYCFSYTAYGTTNIWPFNWGISLGAEASYKNLTLEFSVDHSKFRRLKHSKLNNSIVNTLDLPFNLSQYRILPKYKILSSKNSSLNTGVGLALAYPSYARDNNNPYQAYYLYTGHGYCLNIEYAHTLSKGRLDLFAGLCYEQFIWYDESYSLGQLKSKYDLGVSQYVPIYISCLGLKYRIGQKQIH
jgi:hypothetical protein